MSQFSHPAYNLPSAALVFQAEPFPAWGRSLAISPCILASFFLRVAISKGWAPVLSSWRMLACKASLASFSDVANRVLVRCCVYLILIRAPRKQDNDTSRDAGQRTRRIGDICNWVGGARQNGRIGGTVSPSCACPSENRSKGIHNRRSAHRRICRRYRRPSGASLIS